MLAQQLPQSQNESAAAKKRCLRDSDVHGVDLDTASVLAGDDAEVALLTPAAAPRVADEPVVGRARLAPADGSDTVVDRGGALGGRDDTAPVGLELVGVESDHERAVVVDASLHGADALGGIAVADNLRLDLLGVVLATALACLVRIGRVEHETLLGIGSGSKRPATRAAVVTSGAVDELLLREHRRSALVLLGIGDGDGGNSAEGPAGTAGTLVANSRDPLLATSIERGRKSRNLLSSGLSSNLGGLRKDDASEELLREAIRDRGHTVLGIIALSVVLSSKTHVLIEHLITALLLGVVLVGLAEGGLVGLPERIILESHGAGSSSDKGKCINSLHVRCCY